MKDTEKVHHHFVPQVYLRKFAHTTKGKKHFVYVYDKVENKLYDTPVNNICAKNYLYSLNSVDPQERESIENFYGNFLESAYNDFFRLVTNNSKVTISAKERELIVGTIISLHLRNFYWLKTFQDAWAYFVRSADLGTKADVHDERGKVLYPFSTMDADAIIENSKEDNKQTFIRVHLKKSIEWFQYHNNDLIMIDKIGGLVTSDMPVIGLKKYDSLRVPVNKDYIVTLIPKEEGMEYSLNSIVRNNTFLGADFYNLMQFDNAMRLIISDDQSILVDLKLKYDKTTNS